jgi:hypothetical protein
MNTRQKFARDYLKAITKSARDAARAIETDETNDFTWLNCNRVTHDRPKILTITINAAGITDDPGGEVARHLRALADQVATRYSLADMDDIVTADPDGHVISHITLNSAK